MGARYRPPLIHGEGGRFIRACRACEAPLAEDGDRLCPDCWASDLYCESCGGKLEADMATVEGYDRACACPRPDKEGGRFPPST